MNEHDGLCPCCGGSGGGDDPVRRCPECGGTGRAAIPQTPLAVDVPPGTPLHELARLAADAPEVRREVVTADDPRLDGVLRGGRRARGPGSVGLSLIGGDLCVYLPDRDEAVRLLADEAARRLLAFDDAHAIVAELRRWLADGRAPFAASSFDGSRNWAQVLEDYFTRVSP
jgi:hypothetical protein